MKKIPLEFRKLQYDLKMATYKNRLELEKSVIKEVRLLSGDWPIDFDFTNILSSFFGLLEVQKKKQNSLGLSGEKLAELLAINTENLKALQSQYEATNGAVEPKVEDFTIYAETETEIAKYNDCITLLKAIQGSKNHFDNYNAFKVFRVLQPMLSIDDNQNIVPNIQFIKT